MHFCLTDTSCIQPLGMRSGRIKESQIQSSSFYKDSNDSHGRSPHQARLGGEGYWTPVGRNTSTDGNQFLQINFESPVRLKLVSWIIFFISRGKQLILLPEVLPEGPVIWGLVICPREEKLLGVQICGMNYKVNLIECSTFAGNSVLLPGDVIDARIKWNTKS